MQCIICYDNKWIVNTECNHKICISCLFKIKKDECPYCRAKLFKNFPKKLKSLLNINNSDTYNNLIMDITSEDQFPPLR